MRLARCGEAGPASSAFPGPAAREGQLCIQAAIDLLAVNQRPPGCVALQGEPGVFRVRVGDLLILYEVSDGLLLVQVVRIGHRRATCR